MKKEKSTKLNENRIDRMRDKSKITDFERWVLVVLILFLKMSVSRFANFIYLWFFEMDLFGCWALCSIYAIAGLIFAFCAYENFTLNFAFRMSMKFSLINSFFFEIWNWRKGKRKKDGFWFWTLKKFLIWTENLARKSKSKTMFNKLYRWLWFDRIASSITND